MWPRGGLYGLLQAVCQFCASLELDDFLGRNFYFLFGGGVDALACGTFVYCESAEAEEGYFVTGLEGIGDSTEGGVEGFL